MLPSGLPAAFNAAPESTPSSTNVPSRRLIHNWFGGRVVGDVEIEPAIAVVIADRHAQPVAVGSGDAGRLGDVHEAAAPVVAVQPVGHRAIRARAAVVARADRVVADLVVGDREVEVVGDEEIEIAVAVVVEKGGARAPQRIAHAGLSSSHR